MQIKLLKVEIEGIRLYKNEKFEIDLFANQNVTFEEKEENIVENLASSLNKQNIMAIVGINATGKTTTLKLISSVIEIFIQAESLNNISKKEIFELFKEETKITTHYYANDTIYKLTSDISKLEEKFIFTEETLQEKKVNKGMSKNRLFDFSNMPLVIQRTKEDSAYLKQDDSIFMKTLRKIGVKENRKYLFDMVIYNNMNYFHTLREIPAEYISYLDPSIDYLKFVYPSGIQTGTDIQIQLKFKGSEMKEITLRQLADYLSSGTIKGLYLLISVQQTLEVGGYMIIDEIENHLNKSIVIMLLNLFKSKVNKNNATLIFSTHYSEILDDIERNDCIYFTTKESGEIVVTNLSTKYSRNDRKKSSIFLSGILGTAPQYNSYIEMKRTMKKNVK